MMKKGHPQKAAWPDDARHGAEAMFPAGAPAQIGAAGRAKMSFAQISQTGRTKCASRTQTDKVAEKKEICHSPIIHTE